MLCLCDVQFQLRWHSKGVILKLNGKQRFLPINYIIWSKLCSCLPGGIVILSAFHQSVCPIFTVATHNLGEDVFQGSIFHFHLDSFLRMIGSGSLVLYLVLPHEVLNEMGCKLSPMISDYLSRIHFLSKNQLPSLMLLPSHPLFLCTWSSNQCRL